MKNIRHIFFDLDNTLWDHRKNAYLTIRDLFSKQQIAEQYQIDFEEFHSAYHIINETEILIKIILGNTVSMIHS